LVSEDAVRLALSDHLLTLSPERPTQIENLEFDIPDVPWLQTQLLKNRPVRVAISPIHRHSGIYQVSVHTKPDTDAVLADQIASGVAELFRADTRLSLGGNQELRVSESPEVHGGYHTESWWRVPISIRYEYYEM
jgi:hypothetical protein